jgi:hypothetical protein
LLVFCFFVVVCGGGGLFCCCPVATTSFGCTPVIVSKLLQIYVCKVNTCYFVIFEAGYERNGCHE